ncbi:MAG: M20/M25/M40 family metallo-hydrolase [Spirochaetia bacterium]|nr:M20/M25/M40 family metallo-hydrolase [Spirochaetia bacterium]MCF7942299.1 M20/M25/M40 family metallo-hydrolase [Spirochaetia bacterium]
MIARTIRTERLHALFSDMVDIYSPSGKEDEIVRYLAEYLKGTGLAVVLRAVDETRYNLEISAKRAEPKILFLGHIDTVPAYDIEQYEFSEHQGNCHGLGTADMKGGCAAMIEAFVSAWEGDCLPSDCMLSLVVGEEENGDGTQALLEAWRFSHAIVAEPTNMQPCTSHFGYMELVLTLLGYRRHAALSEKETNAIRTMLQLLLQLEEHVEHSSHEIALNIRDLHSSESGFAVPDSCSASLDLHMPAGVDVARYAQDLEAFLRAFIETSSVNGFRIELPFITDGYVIDTSDPFVEMIKSVYHDLSLPWELESFRSHSDANLLRDAGCTPIILGPGSLSAAHTKDEYVPFGQVVQASEVYLNLLQVLHGRST